MSKIKVGVIDSGIDKEHPLIRNNVKDGIEIRLSKSGRIYYTKNYYDVNGHGTAIAGIIKKIYPNVELYSVKILDKELKSYGILVIEAIKWSIKNRIKIINLSLGTKNKKWRNKLKKICDKAINSGIIIVAANPNENEESYPATFSNVISVTSNEIKGKKWYIYQPNSKVDFIVKRIRIKVAELNKRYKYVEISPSFASAKITGYIAKILGKNTLINFNDVKKFLSNKKE